MNDFYYYCITNCDFTFVLFGHLDKTQAEMPYSMPYGPNGQPPMVDPHLAMSQDELLSTSMGPNTTGPSYHQLGEHPTTQQQQQQQQVGTQQPPPPPPPPSSHYPTNGTNTTTVTPDSSQYYSPYCDSRGKNGQKYTHLHTLVKIFRLCLNYLFTIIISNHYLYILVGILFFSRQL